MIKSAAPPLPASELVGGEREIAVQRSEIIRRGFGRNQRPYTLFRLHATLTSGEPIEGELRTFDSFDTGTHSVTFEPYEAGVLTVKKVRTANDVRTRRSQARAALVGDNVTPIRPPEPVSASNDARVTALEERVAQLEARIEVLLAIVNSE